VQWAEWEWQAAKSQSQAQWMTWHGEKLLVRQQHAVGVRRGAWHTHTHTPALPFIFFCILPIFSQSFFLYSLLFSGLLFLCALVWVCLLPRSFSSSFFVVDCIQNLCCVYGCVCVCGAENGGGGVGKVGGGAVQDLAKMAAPSRLFISTDSVASTWW